MARPQSYTPASQNSSSSASRGAGAAGEGGGAEARGGRLGAARGVGPAPRVLRRVRVPNAGKRGSHTEYPEYFYGVAMEALSTIGCALAYEGVDISLHSSLATAERRDRLKALLLELIEHETGDPEKYAIPDEAPVPKGAKGFAVNVRALGPANKKRREHEEELVRRADEMVQTKDDETLLALEAKYLGKRFLETDGGGKERRVIDRIEWNGEPEVMRWEAVTYKIKADGSRMARPDEQPYGLSPDELPGIDDMIKAYAADVPKRTRVQRSPQDPPEKRARPRR